jgi:hypothetical protein
MRLTLARACSMSAAASSIVIDAARCWRTARDGGIPAQPALYARLMPLGCGALAPVVDALFMMFEAGVRRRFQAGGPSPQPLSGDEESLLDMLTGARGSALERIAPALKSAMWAALRSTRISLRVALDEQAGDRRSMNDPIFFAESARSAPDPHGLIWPCPAPS